MQPHQLTLPLRLQDEATFVNFFAGSNQPLINYLKKLIHDRNENYIYLWGHSGVGCTHLLKACCQYVQEQGRTAAYLPMSLFKNLSPSVFGTLEVVSLVCLDDIQAIAGDHQWEEVIFHFYNRIQASGNQLFIAGHAVPRDLNIHLPDLASRLINGVVFQVQELSDEEKVEALQMRAKLRGLNLSAEVLHFLLNRFPRDLSALFATLEQLERASLMAQRKLTIPFVKDVLRI